MNATVESTGCAATQARIADVRPDPGRWFHPGDVIAGTFVVRGVLGAGGMGQVYAADDLDLQRPVAIKTTTIADGAQLRREAQALAQVHHRNVVSVFRLGSHRGVPFLVMERLYGTTLDELIATRGARRGAIGDDLELLIGVADGLAALHEAGIAHLDLKPGNVILCGGGRTVLVDLGIMVPEVVAGPRGPCGTPMYMAPELIEGALVPGKAGLADLYSFGALAFELFTGAPPFVGGDLTAVLASHLLEEPPELCAARRDLPAALGALVRACLAKRADDRPGSACELGWELRAIRPRRLSSPRRA